MRFIAFVLCFLIAFAQDAAAKTINIVTTTAQVADVVRGVAGNRAHVYSIMGAGVDPHLYQPTRSDMERLMRADMIFYNGLNLEGRMEETLQRLGTTKPVYSIAGLLPSENLLEMMEGEGYSHDPHIWMDVRNWMAAAMAVEAKLCVFDTNHCSYYAQNSASYVDELEDLHTEIKNLFAKIPEQRRVLVTAHDAFGYLGAAYGLEVIGVQGISTESEAGLRRVTDIVNLLVENKISSVFAESSVSEQNIKAIIEGARMRGADVMLGGMLYSDAMGAEGTAESSYIGMMRHNARTIAQGLGGEDIGL